MQQLVALAARWDLLANGDPFAREYFDVYCDDLSQWGATAALARTNIIKELAHVCCHYLFGRRLPKPSLNDFNKLGDSVCMYFFN